MIHHILPYSQAPNFERATEEIPPHLARMPVTAGAEFTDHMRIRPIRMQAPKLAVDEVRRLLRAILAPDAHIPPAPWSQGLAAGVAGDPDALDGISLVHQIPSACLRGRKVILGDDVYRLAVELPQTRFVDIALAQSSLDAAEQDAQAKAHQRCSQTRSDLAEYEDNVQTLPPGPP